MLCLWSVTVDWSVCDVRLTCSVRHTRNWTWTTGSWGSTTTRTSIQVLTEPIHPSLTGERQQTSLNSFTKPNKPLYQTFTHFWGPEMLKFNLEISRTPSRLQRNVHFRKKTKWDFLQFIKTQPQTERKRDTSWGSIVSLTKAKRRHRLW